MDDEKWMRRALSLAVERKGTDPADMPIGAVIVLDGKVIGEGVNMTGENCDATAHAEVMAMRDAGRSVGDMEFKGATLYTTLQPCGMCTFASIWASVSRIVFGAGRDDVHEMYFEDRHLDTIDFIKDAYKRDLTMTGGVLAGECARLYFRPGDDVPEELKGND